MVAIYGTGGFGNTRLETEYGHGFAHEQSALLSMTAATPEQLEENPAELALACSAASHSKTERDLLSIVFRRCAKKSVKGKNTNRKTKPLNPPVVTLSSRDENRRRRYDPWASRRCDSPTGDRPGNCCRTSRHATRDWFCYQSDLSFSADHGHTNRHTTPGHFQPCHASRSHLLQSSRLERCKAENQSHRLDDGQLFLFGRIQNRYY